MKEKKEYLVCIDSDGCAIDSMKIKHTECFGPALAEVWNLGDRALEVQKRWNEINLYSMTRGINRFKGLAMIVKEFCLEEKEAINAFTKWTEEAAGLSNYSLEKACSIQKELVFKKAMKWSLLVNEKIEKLPISLPFAPVKTCVRQIHKSADISVVSSANQEAITEEWRAGGLLEYVDYVFSQSDGSKADCIRKMADAGYDSRHILMVGDAPGDYEAAALNHAWYYPILAGRELDSWENLEQFFKLFVQGQFSDSIQKILANDMRRNLGG